MKFISHLDLNRFMIRMVRKSGIPVWYSEGFNPHPYITFALPLSLGFESDYEVMDIRLADDSFSNDAVLKALTPQMPAGIELIEVGNPIMKAGEVAFASFKVEVDESLSDIEAHLEAFLSAEVIKAEKKTKKGGVKTINLKEYIKDYSVEDRCINLTLAAGGSNNLNPKLLLDTFNERSGITLPPYSITRTMLYNEHMDRFA